MALTSDGLALTFVGRGERGRLGHGDDRAEVPLPKVVEALRREHIVSISAGEEHSMALITESLLLTWGCGEYGRLGHGDDKDLSMPKMASALQGKVISMICAGGTHSTALEAEGLYVGPMVAMAAWATASAPSKAGSASLQVAISHFRSRIQQKALFPDYLIFAATAADKI